MMDENAIGDAMNRLLHVLRVGPYPRSEPHSHGQWEFGWYTQGRGTAWIGPRAIDVYPGILVCYPPQIPHYETTSEPFIGTFIIIDALSKPPPLVTLDDGVSGVTSQLCELMRTQFSGPDAAVSRLSQLLFEALLVYLHNRRDTSSLHPMVQQLQQIIHEHSDEVGFSVGKASVNLPISRDHLRRLFTAEMGCTPVHYLRNVRIQRAQGLLAMGRSIKQSSSESGFDDPYYFSRVFHAVTGQSPSHWRDQQQDSW